MKLSDIRRYAIKKQVRVEFRITGDTEALINEHGLALVPTLKVVPSFSLEDELVRVATFKLQYVDNGRTENLKREAMEKLVASVAPGAAVAADHDD